MKKIQKCVYIIYEWFHSPIKPVNLLPEVPEMRSSGRTLSDREKRDCEVIGKNIILRIFHKIITVEIPVKGLQEIPTPDFSTPSFNPGLLNPRLFNHELLNPRQLWG